MTIQQVKPLHVDLNPKYYRERNHTHIRDVRFVFHGGIGDMIGYLNAIDHIATEHTHVRGQLYVPGFFLDIARNVMAKHTHWLTTKDKKYFNRDDMRTPVYASNNGPPVNVSGSNLINLGFIFFENLVHIPAGWENYQKLDFSEVAAHIPTEKYVVITPGASTKTKAMPAALFNNIKNYVLSKGLTPVLLGSEKIGEKREIAFNGDYDFYDCNNKINKTELIEAAAIMSEAQAVIGIDNGLLHLAAMSEAPIVMGYTITSPEFRRPSRASGNIFDVTIPRSELPCTHCQDHMRFLFNHDFRNCAFDDFKCLELLSSGEGALWKAQIDKALEVVKS